MIRPAKPKDLPEIMELALKAARTYPTLLPSRQRIYQTVNQLTASANDYLCVSERDGVIKGVLAASVNDIFWAERKQAMVMMYYCPTGGEGISLLRDFLRWARKRRAIKVIGMAMDFPHDPRLDRVLERHGLFAQGRVFTEYR